MKVSSKIVAGFLILMLLVRPNGLMGKAASDKL